MSNRSDYRQILFVLSDVYLYIVINDKINII